LPIFSMIPATSNRPRATVAVLAFAASAILLGAAPTAFAQADDDDLYGIPGAASESGPETGSTESPDTAETAPEAPSTPSNASGTPAVAPSPSDTAVAPTPRARVTRETTINPLDTRRGNYRNPKKALFMSLLVPGLGQAYVGQSPYNYARAALYFGTEVTLGVMWYHYTVVKYDRQTSRYKRFADEHWSQGTYEQRVFDESGIVNDFRFINPLRASYCDAVTGRGAGAADSLYRWCEDPAGNVNYPNYRVGYDDRGWSADSVGRFRETFNDPVEFYALIGKYQEFIAGWDDAMAVAYSDSGITGSSANRDAYNAMRRKAQDYSRMQAWFIGGMVLNHIASAVDAALTARHNNRVLYEGEARWYDRVNLDGGLAFDRGRPMTHLSARLSF